MAANDEGVPGKLLFAQVQFYLVPSPELNGDKAENVSSCEENMY